ncbi:hypothetical protein A3F55_01715 [Candidatus Adlerbacteria bacterium RIFCSPHIGHO2_12_FULL_53_18]|uniref:Uncharacterized protein n=1 Tax=Candidatus Adlerbacteria bacterium RIFCSPHIGHO2_12_FULL_53_18 TaxID=1797242 RepID=A0A1F4XTS7_9BACT|nr:MAG: hypothetical protein A3F55_01715 [Candidatus Adlerbacteria bacterium RIFCSPHIGHO2_12_FULL_53_18]
MKTAYYRPRSTYPSQQAHKSTPAARSEKYPAREEIEKCLGSHPLTAVVEEDIQTLTAMKHVEGIVAFLVTLTKEGRVISQGRGSAVLNPMNRFIGRTVACAFNSALADAAIRATKVLDTFRTKPEVEALGEDDKPNASNPATDKQLGYLRQLIQINCEEDERERWESQMGELTKQEASKLIESFKR